MNDLLIDNINAVVGPNDVLYHLGDFAFGDRRQIPHLRSRINCKTIHLIKGNHDNANIFDYAGKEFASVTLYHEMYIAKTLFTLFHYPIASWLGIGKGSFNLFGHCHNTYSPIGLQLDVGVDNILNLYKPWSLDQVFDYMECRELVLVDHHGPKTNTH